MEEEFIIMKPLDGYSVENLEVTKPLHQSGIKAYS